MLIPSNPFWIQQRDKKMSFPQPRSPAVHTGSQWLIPQQQVSTLTLDVPTGFLISAQNKNLTNPAFYQNTSSY